MPSNTRWTLAGLVAAPLVFLSLVVLVWRFGLFRFSGTDASATVVAATVALAGGLVASMVTLIGLILRQSIDRRNAALRQEAERRLDLQSKRDHALHLEEEQRLRLEAAIKAVGLLSAVSGGNVSPTQGAGALFTLRHLGLMELALDLLKTMLSDHLVPPAVAASLLDAALESNDPPLQLKAAEILRDSSEALLCEGGGLEWPDCFTVNWSSSVSPLSKQYALAGLARALLARPRKDWLPESLNALFTYFLSSFRAEGMPPWFRAGAARMLAVLAAAYEPGEVLLAPRGDILLADVQREIKREETQPTTEEYAELARRLARWFE